MGDSKSGGFGAALAQSYSYGLASSNVTSSLVGKNSKLIIDSNEPVFYFYFDNSNSFNRDNWFFASASSLVRSRLCLLRRIKKHMNSY